MGVGLCGGGEKEAPEYPPEVKHWQKGLFQMGGLKATEMLKH